MLMVSISSLEYKIQAHKKSTLSIQFVIYALTYVRRISDTPPHYKTSGGREVIKELFYFEMESLATADPILRGFETSSQPHIRQKQKVCADVQHYSTPRSYVGNPCMLLGPPLHFDIQCFKKKGCQSTSASRKRVVNQWPNFRNIFSDIFSNIFDKILYL